MYRISCSRGLKSYKWSGNRNRFVLFPYYLRKLGKNGGEGGGEGQILEEHLFDIMA